MDDLDRDRLPLRKRGIIPHVIPYLLKQEDLFRYGRRTVSNESSLNHVGDRQTIVRLAIDVYVEGVVRMTGRMNGDHFSPFSLSLTFWGPEGEDEGSDLV